MRRRIPITAALAAFLIAALPPAAEAQSFRCVGKDSKRYYGQVVARRYSFTNWKKRTLIF